MKIVSICRCTDGPQKTECIFQRGENTIMNMSITLFDSIINTSQDCVFWKDKERRFLGVNQAFLDYYGFESADILIGKTDEDMGWHNDPEPYKQDELRVLSGESTYKVQGKCMIRGEERDIIASKRPLYENGEIVGLVGSFVDITDVLRRHGRRDGLQTVYTIDKLRKYPYWDKLLDDTGMDEILDPLTGILSRPYAIDFVHSLIKNGTPFSYSLIDLDNFKYINDSFGHQAGDTVLKKVTASLAEYVEGYGLVGRFGGDELLLINLRDRNAEENEKFFEDLYNSESVFRKNISLDHGNVYVTGTCGCASYPTDAGNFADLFDLIDKVMYLGKNRGRNCYTVYRESEHRDIEIKKLAKHNVFSDMVCLGRMVRHKKNSKEALKSVLPFLTESMQVPDLFYVDRNMIFRSVTNESLLANADEIVKLVNDDLYICNSLSGIESAAPELYNVLDPLGVRSFIAVRIGEEDKTKGYLICVSEREFRIWNENECALVYYIASLLREYPEWK